MSYCTSFQIINVKFFTSLNELFVNFITNLFKK